MGLFLEKFVELLELSVKILCLFVLEYSIFIFFGDLVLSWLDWVLNMGFFMFLIFIV